MSISKFNISGFTLKVLAIFGMTCNHIANVFPAVMPNWLTFILFSLGGLTYPIMAFILTEGYIHTSNLKKYAIRLGIFALISQVPYTLLFGMHANVLVTLLMGLCLLWCYNNISSKPVFFAILVAIEALSYFCDWAFSGPLMVLCFYLLRSKGALGISLTMIIPYVLNGVPEFIYLYGEFMSALTNTPQILATQSIDEATRSYVSLWITGEPILLSFTGFYYLCGLGYALIGFSLAWFFMVFYKGRRGRSMKWFFYAYYPLHIFIIWLVKTLVM